MNVSGAGLPEYDIVKVGEYCGRSDPVRAGGIPHSIGTAGPGERISRSPPPDERSGNENRINGADVEHRQIHYPPPRLHAA